MKAIVQRTFGAPADVLQLADVAKPTIEPGEVLVRVHASSANPWDWHFIRAEPVFIRLAGAGLRSPKHPIPGGDLSGVVEAIGPDVTGFAIGDSVYGFHHGALAEYIGVPQGRLAPMPTNLTFEQAASVPLAAITAYQGLIVHGALASGQKVLVIGASGGVGSFAVQIATAFGAEVTGVCSTRHVDLVRALGATHVIDYTAGDLTRGAERYDLVFQLGGTYSPGSIRRVMAARGVLLLSYGDGGRWFGPMANIIKALLLSPFVGQTLKAFTAKEDTATLLLINELIESGKVTPVIDSSYPLSGAGEAIRLVEEGSPGGKVVITI